MKKLYTCLNSKQFGDDKINATKKSKIVLGWGRKHSWKRRNYWQLVFSFFPTAISKAFFLFVIRVLRGSGVKCLTRNQGVLGLSRTGSSGFYRGSVLGLDTSEPSLVLVKPRKA